MPYLFLAVVGLFLFIQLLRYWIATYTFLGIRFKRASCALAAGSDIAPEISALFSACGADIERLGFDFSHFQMTDEMFVSGYSRKPVMVFRHNAAVVHAELSLSDTLDTYHQYNVEFITVFSDGTSLSTINGQLHGVIGRYPGKTLQDAYTEYLGVQWEAHRKKSEELRQAGKSPVLFPPEEYVRRAENSLNGYVAALIEDGWLRKEEGEAYHRLGFVPAVKAAHSYLGGEGKLRALRQKRIKLAPEGLPAPVPVELEVRNFYRNLELIKGPGLKGMGKAVLLLVTLALFSLTFGFGLSPASLLILIGVLFFHELGHLIAMRACGYQDTKILFLPFLGAATVGAERNPKAFKRVIVSFSGPLPGILLGVLVLALFPQAKNKLVMETAVMLLALNYLNLLPIMPFDGGQIFNVFFTRIPFLQVVFQAGSGLALILAGLGMHETILAVIGAVMLMQIRFVLVKTDVLAGLRKSLPDKNAAFDEKAFLAAVFLKLREKSHRKMSFSEKFTMVKNLKETESFSLQLPSWRLILASLLVYLLLFGAPIMIAARMALPFMMRSKGINQAMMPPQKLIPPEQIQLSPADQALISQLGFDAEIALRVKKTCQGELEQLAGMDEKGSVTKAPGLAIVVNKSGSDEIVDNLRADLKSRGYLVFLVKKNYGGAPDKIAFLKGKDQYEILSIMQTNGQESNVTTKDIVAKLKEWEKKASFDITGADFDWVQIKFSTLPADLNAFAADVYKFCPDSVDQGAGDVKKLAEEIQRTRTLFLWWD